MVKMGCYGNECFGLAQDRTRAFRIILEYSRSYKSAKDDLKQNIPAIHAFSQKRWLKMGIMGMNVLVWLGIV